jgi:ribosomal protein S18 acetylase RimI-like enzyme
VTGMDIEIKTYDDKEHRNQVIDIWTSIFNYKDPRNNPALSIDNKLAVNDNLFFVAIENGEIVGTIMAGYDGHRGWIYSLAVIPEIRRAKIGTKLLKHTESELKKLGCVKINLQIFQHNEIVRDFYLKNGYHIEERISMGKEITENIK